MRVLIFHGYLLRGTGSNIYNASLGRALRSAGHEVHLLCQDPLAERLDWVDGVGTWPAGRLEAPAGGPGRLIAYRPEIGGLLPVYVRDRYEGFRVATFAELTDAERERYVEANARAVADVVGAVGPVDAALANHLIAGPAILARAGVEHAAKIHGSALSYQVRPHPHLLPLAEEGMRAARGVLVGSSHVARSLFETVDVEGLVEKTRLLPPGVDVEAFSPRERATADRALSELSMALAGSASDDRAMGRDPALAARSLERVARSRGPRVGFVGKLIASKGVDLLLGAWPLIAAGREEPLLVIAGFGELGEGLRGLWSALESGVLGRARSFAAAAGTMEGGSGAPLRMLAELLDEPPSDYVERARSLAGSVIFTGRLEHDEVARLTPALDVQVVPSTFPEAFGMVAAEAAAAGVPCVCALHSGLAEVARALDSSLPAAARGLTGFELGEGAVDRLAGRVGGWLDLEPATRRAAGRALAGAVGERWSWDAVARGVIAASRGDLAGLPSPALEPHDGGR